MDPESSKYILEEIYTEDSRFNSGRCCYKKGHYSFPFFLDLIQDNARYRWHNIVMMILACCVAIHFAWVAIHFQEIRHNLNASAPEIDYLANLTSIESAVAAYLWKWAQYLLVAVGVLLISSPMFLGTTLWQNPSMEIPALLFLILVIASMVTLVALTIQYGLLLGDRATTFNWTVIIIISIFELTVILVSIAAVIDFFLRYACAGRWKFRKDEFFLGWNVVTRTKGYKNHVRRLLEPLERSEPPPDIQEENTSINRLNKLPMECCRPTDTIHDLDPQIFHRSKNDFFFPARLITTCVFAFWLNTIMLGGGIAYWTQLESTMIEIISYFAVYRYVEQIRSIVATAQTMDADTLDKAYFLLNETYDLQQSINATQAGVNALSEQIAIGMYHKKNKPLHLRPFTSQMSKTIFQKSKSCLMTSFQNRSTFVSSTLLFSCSRIRFWIFFPPPRILV
jgi:hypothetical protein